MSAKKVPQPTAPFEMASHVIFQLGEQLITNEYQALVELVKNSYDAGSNSCLVKVNRIMTPPEGSAFPNAAGFAMVSDRGKGMSRTDIMMHWLKVSDSPKRVEKARRARQVEKAAESDPATRAAERAGRWPLGDKGLGRLGTQRIGSNVEVFTSDGKEHTHFAFSWDAFRGAKNLSDVRVKLVPPSPDNPLRKTKPGTTVLVSGLGNAFEHPNAAETFNVELSKLISPYASIPNFAVSVEFDGQKLDLISFEEGEFTSAQRTFTIDFNGQRLRLGGSVSTTYSGARLRADTRPLYDKFIAKDNGQRFAAWLHKNKKAKAEQLGFAWLDERHAFHFESTFSEEDLHDKEVDVEVRNGNPGPFDGYVHAIDLPEAMDDEEFLDWFGVPREQEGEGAELDLNPSLDRDETSRKFKEFSGIRVYRDGFEVRMSKDWLDLGRGQTESSSFYNLRPSNVLGCIRLTTEQNQALEETSSRQDFTDSRAFRNFKELNRLLVSFSRDCQAFIRRSEMKFIAEMIGGKKKTSPTATTMVQASSEAGKLIAKARQLARQGDAVKAASVLDDMQDQISVLKSMAEEAERNKRFVHQVAALGISAESFAHELHREIKNLRDDVKQLLRKIKAGKAEGQDMRQFLAGLERKMLVLQKQAAVIEPQLSYIRESKKRVSLAKTAKDFVALQRPNLLSQDIEIECVIDDGRPPQDLRINEGRLALILGNLLDNSVYWVRRAVQDDPGKKGKITLTVSGLQIWFEDNGPGISKQVENTLFEPFESMKPQKTAEGRGLGLFIVKNMVTDMRCSITLDHERNRNDRLFRFILDFTGAMFGDE